MSFDIDKTLGDMARAIAAVFTDEWPGLKDCMENAIEDEKEALTDIAKARLAEEITDDDVKSQLEDERKTLEASLLVCQVKAKKMVQEAVNAALIVFEKALTAAIGAM